MWKKRSLTPILWLPHQNFLVHKSKQHKEPIRHFWWEGSKCQKHSSSSPPNFKCLIKDQPPGNAEGETEMG